MSSLFKNCANKLRFIFAAEDDDAEAADDVLSDLDDAKDDATKNEELPPLADDDDVLDLGTEEPFEKALTPSLWSLKSSGQGYITFEKSDSEAAKDAKKGKYSKDLPMDTGKIDESILDYVNAFLVHNKINSRPTKHLTMKTDSGPRTTDMYDNEVTVVHEWRHGKLNVTITWRPHDPTISIPPQFEKEEKLPDELVSDDNNAEIEEEPAKEESEVVPSLDQIESMPEGEPDESEEEEETPEEEAEKEPEETTEEASGYGPGIIRWSRLSRTLSRIAEDLDDDEETDEDSEEDDSKEDDEAEDESDDDKKADEDSDDEVEEDDNDVPVSTDVHEIVNNLLLDIKASGQTVFQDYIENEALAKGRLFADDFNELDKLRSSGETDRLRQKELEMAERIYSDIDRIVKNEAQSKKIEESISDLGKDELKEIIADNIEVVSTSDKGLSKWIQPEDIMSAPDESHVEEELSHAEQLVEEFYKIRGSLSSQQRLSMTDDDILEIAHDHLSENLSEDDDITDEDVRKARELISNDLESRGDLSGAP